MNASGELTVNCPVCDSPETFFALKVKDYSVSGEYFDIYGCPRCNLRFTYHPPASEKIGVYYESEDYISHSNTRKGIVNSLYHSVRHHTLSVKFHLIEKSTGLKTGQHLDIGAGTGAFVQYMTTRGWQSLGIEPDVKARELAVKHHNTTLLPAESFETVLPESFDAVTMWHVLEHVHDLYPYLHQIKKILKSGGLAFIAVPNYTSYDGQKYGEFWAAYDVPRHLYHFSPASMKWLLSAAGLELTRIVPMWYDSYYISLLSEKYKNGHASLPRGFINGAVSNLKALRDRERCSSLIYIAKKSDPI
jgi:2-polyprenyl-3-methyl-5-hydroxy-6-metoxy-1,4-benzoquinol methylase